MIKADQGTVIMKGLPIDLLAELCTVLKSARENFGDKYVDLMVEQSKILGEESKKKSRRSMQKGESRKRFS